MNRAGTLYVVATPIGNLGDLTARAREILAAVDLIAAEDTRHTGRLLQSCGIETKLISLHEHNEAQRVPQLLDLLREGRSIALVSDAGTPLVSDPGFRLVQAATQAGLTVSPVPGASAVIAALSAAGLPSDRFSFEGFLPAKATARRSRLQTLAAVPHTLVFYEAPHRLIDTLEDLQAIFGKDRQAVVARELTKTYETFCRGTLSELLEKTRSDEAMRRGEIVLLVAGAPEQTGADDRELERILGLLLKELPVSRAAELAAAIAGVSSNHAYRTALRLTGS